MARPMENHLDIVSYGVENIRSVVVGVVLRAKARFPIIFSAYHNSGGVECIDCSAVYKTLATLHEANCATLHYLLGGHNYLAR